MRRKIKNIEGITLMVLVITIILLIMLAGLTLSLVLGPNGIIVKAQYAKVQSEIGSEKEQLSMAVTEATVDNNGQKPTLEQIKNKIIEKDIATENNVKVGEDRLQVTTPKGHTYTIDDKGNIEYIGEGAVVIPNLTDANVTFTYTPSTWTNGDVQVGIATTVDGYKLQYSMDGDTWNTYTGTITVTTNESIYARLWDGINYGGTTTGNITNIDKVSPTLTISTTNTTNSITVTATGADNESGIAGYKYSKDNGNTWTDTTTSNTYTFTGLTQGQLYQILVQVSDKAGNTVISNETVTTGEVTGLMSDNTTFTYTPSTWTNGSVQVAITTTVNGYTLQYSTDGNTWNNYTSAITATNNQAIYARLWDGTNYGGTATGNVTNIDNTNPALTLNQDSGTTSRTITINATDTQSGINIIQYNNYGTWQNLGTSNITNGKSVTQTVYLNGTYTFRTIDNVGNVTSQSTTVTGVTPLISNLRGGVIISSTDNIALRDDEGNMITIPAGFKVAGDSATKQEDGVVIQDNDNNQFVWIPVANVSSYARTNFQTSADYNNYSEAMPSDEQTSVSAYHGYYIGRYEAGDSVITASRRLRGYDSVTDKISISKGQAPYNYITRDQSKALAEGMDTVEGYKARTKLCSSFAWDTAIRFIQNRVANYGTSSPQGNYMNLSFNYIDIAGNLQNKPANTNTLIPTGQTTPVCNIYDMGGNDWEWTSETCNITSYSCTYRGGSSGFNYTGDPAGWRCYDGSTYKNVGVAFRVTLYL